MKTLRSAVKPVVIGSHFCDAVMYDAVSSKPTLIGIFNRLIVPKQFPFTSSPFFVYISLTDGPPSYEWSLKLRFFETGKVIWKDAGPGRFNIPTDVAVLDRTIEATFECPGIYSLEFSVDNEVILERRLTVLASS